jgi:hypothetical protein
MAEVEAEILGLLRFWVDLRGSLRQHVTIVCQCERRDVLLNRRPPSRSSRRVTARETVATDMPIAWAAPANDRSSATLANIASPSKSGSFDIDIPATIAFIPFYFENAPSATNLCGPQRNTEMRYVGQDS